MKKTVLFLAGLWLINASAMAVTLSPRLIGKM